ncbi:MAG: prolyl oligopeptidase family serine peptidase [Anaerolineae bacterium]|nr:prolyl oligopeptidase family serine peptidase [Anaerolineae bacterium]
MTQTPESFTAQVTQTVGLDFLLYLPPDYESQAAWPLILFLHGYGERGSDLDLVAIHGLPKRIAAGDDFPFIIASPQCPDTTVWPEQVEALNALLDHLLDHYKVDPARVYLTGLSMGGYGTWFLASRYPERFAAIAPICGGGGWWMTQALATLPTWVFHGDADETVPLIESEVMVERIEEAGGDIRLTVYPDVGHNSWTATYDNPELYTWFLSHTRAE